MKQRFIALTLSAVSLLVSCGKQKELRSDISYFIASFSVAEAMKTYQRADYQRDDYEGNVHSIETMSFDVRDLENIEYHYRIEKYVGGEIDKIDDEILTKEEENYYITINGVKTFYTTEQVLNNFVSKFFYRKTFEGGYLYGMYVGDMLKDIIYDIQDYTYIDYENKLLVYSVNQHRSESGFAFSQKLEVDNLGLVVTDHSITTNGLTTRETVIEVHNYSEN